MTSHLQDEERKVIGEQAARWLAELKGDDVLARDAFVSWLKQSPRHVEEYLLVSATWQAFASKPSRDRSAPQDAAISAHEADEASEIERIVAEALADTPGNVVSIGKPSTPPVAGPCASPLRSGEQVVSARPVRARLWVAGMAAGLAAIGCVLAWTHALERLLSPPDSVRTSVGEQRTVRLVDGSIVYLNARSRIRVAFSSAERDIELDEGEAVFKVAHDVARPFRVHAGGATVQAVGTEFNVYRRASETTVSVLEGKVEIRPAEHVSASTDGSAKDSPALTGAVGKADAPVLITAGEQARITSRAVTKQAEPDVIAAVAWRQRRLVFRAARLEDIAAEFGRYSPQRIQLEDAVAREMRFTGTFDADDPGSLVLFLEKLNELSVRRDGEDFVIHAK